MPLLYQESVLGVGVLLGLGMVFVLAWKQLASFPCSFRDDSPYEGGHTETTRQIEVLFEILPLAGTQSKCGAIDDVGRGFLLPQPDVGVVDQGTEIAHDLAELDGEARNEALCSRGLGACMLPKEGDRIIDVDHMISVSQQPKEKIIVHADVPAGMDASHLPVHLAVEEHPWLVPNSLGLPGA